MSTLDEILSGKEPTTEPTPAPEPTPTPATPEPTPTGETEAKTQPRDEHGRFAPKASDTPTEQPPTAAPPAAKQDEPVFSPATLDERRKRQAAEKERDDLRRQLEAMRNPPPAPPQRPDVFQDPEGAFKHVEQTVEEKLLNERLNMSEIMIRSQHQDADQAIEAFQEAMRANPALQQQAIAQVHPYKFVYEEGKRILALKEIGDPLSYKERVEKELREKLLAEMQQAQPQPTTPAPVLPTSLAGVRSATPPSPASFTGPTPIGNILSRR